MTIEPMPADHDRSVTDVRPRRRPGMEAAVLQTPVLRGIVQGLGFLESWIAPLLRRISGPLLRGSLALVFVWFGALKIAGVTPVADLVADSVPWLDRSWFIPFLGLVEIVLGAALLLGRYLTIISLIFVGHLAATFLVLVMQPELAFQHGNPMLLTTIGEFVVKNLVLASAAIAVSVLTGPNRPAARQGRTS